MWKPVILLLLVLAPLLSGAQITADPEVAFERAAATNRPVLLLFEGSDWCIPCIKLDKKVISTEAFTTFASENIVVLKADFPQKKKIKPELAHQYEALAEAFNKEGTFPSAVLLTASKKRISAISVTSNDPKTFIAAIRQALKQHHEDL